MSNPHGATFAGRVGWGARPAVVVVDLVRACTQPAGPFFLGAPTVVDGCADLVAAAREGGHRVLWTANLDAEYADVVDLAGAVDRRLRVSS